MQGRAADDAGQRLPRMVKGLVSEYAKSNVATIATGAAMVAQARAADHPLVTVPHVGLSRYAGTR